MVGSVCAVVETSPVIVFGDKLGIIVADKRNLFSNLCKVFRCKCPVSDLFKTGLVKSNTLWPARIAATEAVNSCAQPHPVPVVSIWHSTLLHDTMGYRNFHR